VLTRLLIRRGPRWRPTLWLLTTTVSLAACGGGDPFRVQASFPNAERRFELYGLSGPSRLPAALDLYAERVVIPEVIGQSANFELAFDIDGQGRVTVLPTRLVAIPPAAPPTIEIQVVSGSFDALSRAPTSGYVRDSSRTLAVGQVLAFSLPTSSQCTFQEPYYGKLVVDSVFQATRRIVLRTLVNRNCGYRALTVGLPTD
jgi:hypothetical protein